MTVNAYAQPIYSLTTITTITITLSARITIVHRHDDTLLCHSPPPGHRIRKPIRPVGFRRSTAMSKCL